MSVPQAFPLLFAAVAGACVGSFVSTAVLRQLRGEQALTGRSRCDGCARRLGFMETAPVLSYAIAGGSCRCGSRIDSLHPVGELAGAAIAALAWSTPADTAGGFLTRGLVTLGGLILLGLSLYDARTYRLPDGLTACMLSICILLAVLRRELVLGLFCGVAVFLVLEAVRRSYARLRGRAGLGFGDVKLLAALAVWLGTAIAWAVVVASTLALVWLLVSGQQRRRLR